MVVDPRLDVVASRAFGVGWWLLDRPHITFLFGHITIVIGSRVWATPLLCLVFRLKKCFKELYQKIILTNGAGKWSCTPVSTLDYVLAKNVTGGVPGKGFIILLMNLICRLFGHKINMNGKCVRCGAIIGIER